MRVHLAWPVAATGIVILVTGIASTRTLVKQSVKPAGPVDFLQFRQGRYQQEIQALETLVKKQLAAKAWSPREAQQHEIDRKFGIETDFISDMRYGGGNGERAMETNRRHLFTRSQLRNRYEVLKAAGLWVIKPMYLDEPFLTPAEFVAASTAPRDAWQRAPRHANQEKPEFRRPLASGPKLNFPSRGALLSELPIYEPGQHRVVKLSELTQANAKRLPLVR